MEFNLANALPPPEGTPADLYLQAAPRKPSLEAIDPNSERVQKIQEAVGSKIMKEEDYQAHMGTYNMHMDKARRFHNIGTGLAWSTIVPIITAVALAAILVNPLFLLIGLGALPTIAASIGCKAASDKHSNSAGLDLSTTLQNPEVRQQTMREMSQLSMQDLLDQQIDPKTGRIQASLVEYNLVPASRPSQAKLYAFIEEAAQYRAEVQKARKEDLEEVHRYSQRFTKDLDDSMRRYQEFIDYIFDRLDTTNSLSLPVHSEIDSGLQRLNRVINNSNVKRAAFRPLNEAYDAKRAQVTAWEEQEKAKVHARYNEELQQMEGIWQQTNEQLCVFN